MPTITELKNIIKNHNKKYCQKTSGLKKNQLIDLVAKLEQLTGNMPKELTTVEPFKQVATIQKYKYIPKMPNRRPPQNPEKVGMVKLKKYSIDIVIYLLYVKQLEPDNYNNQLIIMKKLITKLKNKYNVKKDFNLENEVEETDGMININPEQYNKITNKIVKLQNIFRQKK